MTGIFNFQFSIFNFQFGSIVTDPSWPSSLPTLATPSFLIIASVLVVLTLWTYHGVRNANPRRVIVVLVLRLLALLLAFLAVLRPSFPSRGDLRQPSVLLILPDGSESMTN